MNRITTALLAALEALIVVAIGMGIALVPLTILWATRFGLAIDWVVFWRAAADVWLLGNGVDLTVHLTPAVVSALGLPAAATPFPITIAPLGFALLAVLLGVRTGKRAVEAGNRVIGVVASILAYGILAALITFSASGEVVRPAELPGILLPTAIFAAGVLVGAGPWGVGGSIRWRYDALSRSTHAVLEGALRGGTAAAVAVIAVSAVVVAALIVVNYATIIGLYESMQADVMGGITLTLAQLALIPNLVIWAAAWFVGPGIAIGVGTSVSPVGTSLGSVPGLPILGALPHGTLALGFIGLLVPVLAGFAAGVLARHWPGRPSAPEQTTAQRVATGLVMGAVAGILLGLLAWWSSGAIGPGRLADVGPNPLLVGVLAAVEIGIGAGVGMISPVPVRRKSTVGSPEAW